MPVTKKPVSYCYLVLIAIVMSCSFLTTARAQNVDQNLAKTVADTLIETMSKVSGDTFAYKTVEFDETLNEVVIGDVTLVRRGAKRPALIVSDTRISNAILSDEGGFTADSIRTENIKIQAKSLPGSVASAEAQNVTVKAADQVGEGGLSQWFAYTDSRVTNLAVGGTEEERAVRIAQLNTVAEINDENVPVAGEVDIVDMVVQVDQLPSARIRKDLASLGYETMRFSLDADGTYDIDGQTLNVNGFTLIGAETATLDFSAQIGGIPASFMASPLDPRTIIATASIGDLDLKIDDHSITNRILTMQAEKSGTTAEALAGQLTGGLGFFLAALQNPDFQKQATEAISSFLTDPQSIQVSMKPAQPTPFIQVFAAATSAPGTLVELLGLSISANR